MQSTATTATPARTPPIMAPLLALEAGLPVDCPPGVPWAAAAIKVGAGAGACRHAGHQCKIHDL